MKKLLALNLENVSEKEISTYKIREAARAIVLDESGLVALLHARKYDYYKLPGGGVEEGEDILSALARECREEIGCEVEVAGEVGLITEYRSHFKLKQTSYCFLAKIIGKKGIPDLTQGEIEEGFEVVWLPFEEAVKKVRESAREIYEANYMVKRDLAFLEEVRKIISP